MQLKLPMNVEIQHGYENSVSIERGPLVYALKIEEAWKIIDKKNDIREVRPKSPWNYGLLEKNLKDVDVHFEIVQKHNITSQPWNLKNAPIIIKTTGVRLDHWKLYNEMAGPIPCSPQRYDKDEIEEISLIPYGCTTLRISAFPTVQ